MVFYLFWSGLTSGCGVQSSIPSDAAPPSQAERAVTIVNIEATVTGSMITCELNEALVAPGVSIPLFLEYEGTEIERTTLVNQATFTFSEFNPPSNGKIVCVVEFADAEFESESENLDHIP